MYNNSEVVVDAFINTIRSALWRCRELYLITEENKWRQTLCDNDVDENGNILSANVNK